MIGFRAPLSALLLAVALPASAQLAAADRQRGLPAGLTVPVQGAAAAEEPTALSVNPAGIGFVGGFALQYFHEALPAQRGWGDGLYLADRFGPAAIGYSAEWLQPGRAPFLSRYQRQQLAFAVGDGRAASLGFGWTWIASHDGAITRARSWQVGATARPFRHVSLAAAALGNGAHLGPTRLPVRFDLGAASRVWDDRLTVSADLLADDAGQPFRTTYARLGAGVEIYDGLVLGARVDLPLRDDPGGGQRAAGFVTLTGNAPHVGFTAGGMRFGDHSGWLAGVRVSEEKYRPGGAGLALPSISLPGDLQPRRFLWLTVGDRDPYALLVERVLAARDDPEVGALLLKIDSLPFGSARVEELRTLLAKVREHKPVLAYLTGGGTREYWLASAATVVASPPGAPLLVNGLSTSHLYYRNLLARLGVGVEVVRAGAYKSAVEPYVRTGPSPEAKQITESVLDDVFGRFVADVAKDRRLDAARVRALVDQGIFTSEEARSAGLLDTTIWPDEVPRWARQISGRRLLGNAGPYRPEPVRVAQRWGRPKIVEIVRLSGLIARRGAGGGLLGEDPVASATAVGAAIHRAADDREVKAIVLRVESPGGDAFASDLLWREVVRARKEKPVVVSMGDYAASGGYLVAAAADAIVAEPSTLTGSIGVFGAKPDLGGLLEKLSIQRDASARGEKAQALSLLRPWSEAERAAMQRQIDVFYGSFLDRVAAGRRLTRAQVEEVAAGRVWTGRQALERKLVDRLGTLADAVALARERAGLAEGDVVVRRRTAERAMLDRVGLGAATAETEPSLARLALSSPEVEAMFLMSDGGLGPVLALPEDWAEGP